MDMLKTTIIRELGFWLTLDSHTVSRNTIRNSQLYFCCKSLLEWN